MFTGIIKEKSIIKKITEKNQGLFIDIAKPKKWNLKEGESISVNGICSTVCKLAKKVFQIEYMPETINKTTVSEWFAGLAVNLERSLKLSDLVDGHLVSGHVDTKGKIIGIEDRGDSKIFTVEVLNDFMKYIASKGSVALDGVSLTVVDVLDNLFTVSLVSYTILNTNFGNKKIGESINVETDLLAKYIYNIYAKERK